MKVGELHAFRGEAIEFRGFEVGVAKAAQTGVAHVVDHHDDQVGSLGCVQGTREEKNEKASMHRSKRAARMWKCKHNQP